MPMNVASMSKIRYALGRSTVRPWLASRGPLAQLDVNSPVVATILWFASVAYNFTLVSCSVSPRLRLSRW